MTLLLRDGPKLTQHPAQAAVDSEIESFESRSWESQPQQLQEPNPSSDILPPSMENAD